MKVPNIKEKSIGDTFAFVGLFFSSHMPNPTPHPTNKVGRVYPEFFRLQHCVGWREGELQEHFAKDALFYEGIHKLQKIMNTALLSQALHPCFV